MTHRWKVFTCQRDFPENSIFCCTTCQSAIHEQRHTAAETEHFLQPAWWAVYVMTPCCQGACVPASVILTGTGTSIQTYFKKRKRKKTNVRHCKEGILKCQSLRNILLTRFCYFAQIYVVLPWESVCFCNQKFTLNQMLMSDFLLVIYQLYAAWRSWSKVLLRAG